MERTRFLPGLDAVHLDSILDPIVRFVEATVQLISGSDCQTQRWRIQIREGIDGREMSTIIVSVLVDREHVDRLKHHEETRSMPCACVCIPTFWWMSERTRNRDVESMDALSIGYCAGE